MTSDESTPTTAPNDETNPDESPETTDRSGRAPTDDAGDESSRLGRYVNRAILAGLLILAVVAALRFYFAASNAIDYWVADAYRSMFQAAFNLVVLLAVSAGIGWQLRRVRGGDDGVGE